MFCVWWKLRYVLQLQELLKMRNLIYVHLMLPLLSFLTVIDQELLDDLQRSKWCEVCLLVESLKKIITTISFGKKNTKDRPSGEIKERKEVGCDQIQRTFTVYYTTTWKMSAIWFQIAEVFLLNFRTAKYRHFTYLRCMRNKGHDLYLYVLLHTDTTRHFRQNSTLLKPLHYFELLGIYFNKFKKFDRVRCGVKSTVTFTLT